MSRPLVVSEDDDPPHELILTGRSQPQRIPDLRFVRDDSLGKFTYVAEVPPDWGLSGAPSTTPNSK